MCVLAGKLNLTSGRTTCVNIPIYVRGKPMEEEKLSFNLPNWDTNPPLPEWNLPPHLGKAQLSIVKKNKTKRNTVD